MSVRVRILAIVFLLGSVCPARGTVYHVSSSGSDANGGTSATSAWQTLAKANKSVVAGDLVLVHEGQYGDGIRPRNSGQAGRPITYQAVPGEQALLITADGVQLGPDHSHIIVDGFEVRATSHLAILTGSSYITIRNCKLYGGRGDYSALLLDGASYCVIQNNFLDRGDTGADNLGGDGVKLAGTSHHNLIEGNTAIHCLHVGFASSLGNGIVYQSYNVWRNNTAYYNHTNFSLQDGVQRTLFENNTGYYPGLIWTGGNGWCLQFTGTNCIIRFNTLYDDTGTVYTARRWPGIVGAGSGSVNGGRPSVLHNKIYNNTVYGENDQKEWSKEGWRIDNYAADLTQNENAFINNIIARAPWVQVDDIDGVRPLEQMRNRYVGNLLCGPPGQGALVRYEYSGGCSIWTLEQVKRSRPEQWASSNIEGDPMFVNTIGQGPAKDFRLQPGSPAVDAGVHLTNATASGGTSTRLAIADAGFFIDGWGIPGVEGDSIRIEGDAPVGITHVDYGSNTLTLQSPRSWAQWARIFYYRSDRFQGGAPDIGAHERAGAAPPPPPPPPPPPIPPTTPILFAPGNGAVDVEPNVTLRWNPVDRADSYRIQVSKDSTFSFSEVDVSVASPARAMSSLAAATKHFWRVNARNAGGTSDWSRVWTLTTVDPENPPANIISNPRFDNGVESWSSYSSGEAEFTVSSPGINSQYAGKLHIISAGDNTQIFQIDLPLEPNTRYIFSFAGYSRSGNDVDVSVAKHLAPFTNYGLDGVRFDLDTTWKTFTTEFTTRNLTVPVNDARFRFSFAPHAAAGDQYFLDDIVLTPAPVPLLAPTPIAPGPRATDQPTDVVLRWSKRAEASTYAVEVALDSAFAALVASDSAVGDTMYHVNSLKNLTTYYWHVSAMSGTGMSSFSPVHFFTTAPAILPVPVLAAYPDSVRPVSFTVSWSSVAGAAAYHLQLATDEQLTALILDDSLAADTSLGLGPLQHSTRYYLRIRALSSVGSSPFSAPVSFRTVPEALAAPSFKVLPLLEGLVPREFTLGWSVVSGAEGYHLQIALDSLFQETTVNDSTFTDTLAAVGPLNFATTYFARLRATGPYGNSPFSAVVRFTTVPEAIATPAFAALPTENGLLPLEFTVSWFRVSGATRYHLQVALDSLYSSFVLDDSTITDTVVAVGPLLHATTYFMRLHGIGPVGHGPFSHSISFTVSSSELSVPVFLPLPGEVVRQPAEIALVWHSSPGASHYHLQLSTDSLFSLLSLDDSTLTDTVRHLDSLQLGVTYYVRLRAMNAIGRSPFSDPLRFATRAADLAVPSLTELPVENVNRPLVTLFRWLPVPGAERYHLQVSADQEFSLPVVDDSTLTDTVAQVGPLEHATSYRVRVRAVNDRVSSPFSAVYQFSTIPAPPPAPGGIHIVPHSQELSILFSWLRIAGADTYHIQVSEDSLFATSCFDDSSVTDTVTVIGSLSASTTYFARVRARGIGGIGPFSALAAFTTAGPPQRSDVPRDYLLEQNYPNPFNPSTKIRYEVPADVHVRISLFNTLGQLVNVLVDAGHSAGRYEIELDAIRLASGVYYYLFEAGNYVQTRRFLVLK